MEPEVQLKVLHVLQDKDKSSGLFASLVIGLERKQLDQSVCYLKGHDNTKVPFQNEGIKAFSLGRKVPGTFNPYLVWQIVSIIRQGDINLVHCQRHKPTVYGTLAAWIAGGHVKVVTSVHGKKRTRGFTRKLTNYFIFKRINRIISVSRAVRQDILRSNPGLNPEKVVTIYNGIDAQKYILSGVSKENAQKKIGIPEKAEIVFGTVGRLAPVKGQNILLKAFAKLVWNSPDAWLVIAGTGPLEQELKKLAAELSIQDRIIFLGYRNDIPWVLNALDCFVLPSLSEGHPLSLLEAMAAEKTVVVSRVGGIPEVLTGIDFGMMVMPGSVEALTSAMEKVCRMTAEERSARGKILRRRVVEHYTTHKMAENTACLYQEVVLEQKNINNIVETDQLQPGKIHCEKIDKATDKKCLTGKEHWDNRWDRVKLPAIIEPDTPNRVAREILKIFNRFLPQPETNIPFKVLEIGGAPGPFLAYMARYLGYQPFAIDYSEVGCQKMKENFEILGLDVTLYHRDFFDDLSDLPRFDLVFSMGFVEHFNHLDDVVAKHVRLVKKDGLLLLGVPNFRGVSQKVLSRLTPNLLSMHNLEAMDIGRWNHFESLFGLEPLFKGYVGGFEPKNFRRCENRTLKNQAIRLFFKTVRFLVTDPFPFLRKYNSAHWSAYLLGVYRVP